MGSAFCSCWFEDLRRPRSLGQKLRNQNKQTLNLCSHLFSKCLISYYETGETRPDLLIPLSIYIWSNAASAEKSTAHIQYMGSTGEQFSLLREYPEHAYLEEGLLGIKRLLRYVSKIPSTNT